MYSPEKNPAKFINPMRISQIVLIFFCGFIFSCATPIRTEPGPSTSPTRQSRPAKKSVDKVKLAKSLGVYKDIEDIGFHQVSFNDCSIPREFRKGSACSTQYLSVINFRMRCRNSEGTVEQQVSNYELEPMVSSDVRWGVGKLEGSTATDNRGYGRAIVRSHNPIGAKQFRLTANGQVMAVTARLVRQFVLPRYWCR